MPICTTEQSHLYTLQVTLYNRTSQTDVVDIYRIPHVSILSIRLAGTKFLVNERLFYFYGANAYEGSDFREKGFDRVISSKHFNLYGWLHEDSFRASHYPYADEFYCMADRYSLAIIGETTAAALNYIICSSQTSNYRNDQW